MWIFFFFNVQLIDWFVTKSIVVQNNGMRYPTHTCIEFKGDVEEKENKQPTELWNKTINYFAFSI